MTRKGELSLKYWRGYLTAAIFAAFSWVLMQLGEKYSTVVDMIYPYITRSVQSFLAEWSAGADYLVWQAAAMLLVVVLLATIVAAILLRWNPIQWFGWVLAAASVVFFLHTGIWGLNYYSGPLAEDIRLETMEYTVSELEQATTYFRDQANLLSSHVRRDSNQDAQYADFETLAEKAGEGFHYLTYEASDSVFGGSTLPVKKLGFAPLYSSMGITGFTFPLTGEAAVNPEIPVVSLPFTMAHEMAHRMCMARERDANFAAFLACDANSDEQFRYSAYFMAYLYCYNTLYRLDAASADRINASRSDLLKHDMQSYAAFFDEKKDETATKAANTMNNTYIKTSGDDRGTLSYDDVTDDLVSWYYQEIVAPTIVVEEEHTFDPYDESQVDLTGIVHAIVPETEPEAEEG